MTKRERQYHEGKKMFKRIYNMLKYPEEFFAERKRTFWWAEYYPKGVLKEVGSLIWKIVDDSKLPIYGQPITVIINRQACSFVRFGVKTRISIPHTCGKEKEIVFSNQQKGNSPDFPDKLRVEKGEFTPETPTGTHPDHTPRS